MGPSSRQTAIHTTEGHIFILGIAFALLYLAFLSVCALLSPGLAQALTGITASNLLFGRAAGMSLSYAFGFSHGAAMPLNMLIETILVLLFYPLFVFSLTQLLVIEWVKKVADRTNAAAQRHQGRVRRWGIPGLMLFVWFPFSMTGPMVGCLIGHMIGLQPWLNVAVVLGSTYLAIACWGLLLEDLLEKLSGVSTYAPIAVVATVLAVLLLSHFIRSPRSGRRV